MNGKVESEEEVTFAHSLPNFGITATYKGTVEGDMISGSVDFEGQATGTFSGERE